MKRLKHPVRAIREPFGTAGLVVAVIALVAALAGTAIAAAGLNSKQKREVKSIAKSFQGTGPAGPAGANGTNGTNGAKGDTGAPGTNGVSVTTASFGAGLHGCTEGGIEVKSASPTAFVCNGAKGATGPAGPLIETAPSNYTMRGNWAVVLSIGNEGNGNGLAPVSFPLRLASAPSLSVFVPTSGPVSPADEEACPGTAAEPKAKAGVVCFYAEFEVPSPVSVPVVLKTRQGATAFVGGPSEGTALGTWAVTAP